ncbi:MAG TPA: LysM domain-containing protein, partial [Verrucomicrobiae bacterium]
KKKLEAWRASDGQRPVAPTNQPLAETLTRKSTPEPVRDPSRVINRAGAWPTGTRPESASARARTHLVQSGETVTAIARKYGLKLNALLLANPTLEPNRVRTGQTLNIPSS